MQGLGAKEEEHSGHRGSGLSAKVSRYPLALGQGPERAPCAEASGKVKRSRPGDGRAHKVIATATVSCYNTYYLSDGTAVFSHPRRSFLSYAGLRSFW